MAGQHFTSRLNTILTMVGVAVGLGNIWRFPYMMGSYGGSAFLLIFLVFVALFSIPAVMGEWALGRATGSGPIGAFSKAFGPRTGTLVGMMLTLAITVADAYYLLVIAYIAYTAVFGALYGFGPDTRAAYTAGMENGWLQYAIALVLLALTILVLNRGLHRGIERLSKLIVPFFGLAIIALVIRAFSLDGALEHTLAFLKPDWAAVNRENVFAAMGQAIFSLSLGGTTFVIYGSYLRSNERIPTDAVWTGIGDVGAALAASLFIVPATLAFGLELGQGPGLIFETLPELFHSMPGGRVLGVFFLLGLTLIAFLSNVAALQVTTGGLNDNLGFSKKKTLTFIAVFEILLILPVALDPVWIGRLDLIVGSGMQCLGCALALIALTFGLGGQTTLNEIFKARRPFLAPFLLFWLRWVIPAILFLTLGLYIWDKAF